MSWLGEQAGIDWRKYAVSCNWDGPTGQRFRDPANALAK